MPTPITHKFRKLFDAHLHLRTGDLLEATLPYVMRRTRCAVVMPNVSPAVIDAERAEAYRDEIMSAARKIDPNGRFEPLMTIEIRDSTTPLDIFRARKAGVIAGKAYPIGVTTNSDRGLRDFTGERLADTFRAMAESGMPLLIHGETPHEGVLITDRERGFLPNLFYLAANFPILKIVLEHVSTEAGIDAVGRLGPNVAATITLHHLLLTLNDILVGGTHPHSMCNPVPKGFADRSALFAAAVSGSRKFFLGSDSAPHWRSRKECEVGACGVFSAPVLLEGLAMVFDRAGKLDQLEDFAVRRGLGFYDLSLHDDAVEVAEQSWVAPGPIGDQPIVPFLAGQKLPFCLLD